MSKYEIRTQKKKDAIIKASLELFRTKGYTNTSINEIAACAEVSAVSIYNYFQNKENLVKECASALLGEVQEMVSSLLYEEMSFKDRLLRAVTLCAEKPHELLAENFSQEALEDKVFVELLGREMSKIRLDVISVFIESGKSEGVINPSIATDTILHFLLAASQVQAAWKTQEEYKANSRELYHLILYGMIGQ
ncbi:TetR family transcriptional regulator [Kineothrix alysoides]|uniref:TetR family transcriptional regulator n=1 Tax=Kineothrix alysoides TaxID=1469948 RepID=A0A4R1QQG0_9FIRM|nr:TetR/AcrR family transcriptional regulator [Kineothrix alysoides]TCL55191.1 TetR family transcriptional regulator [Kineothrix alysoides]